jgi:hypothetical protein
VTRVVVCWNGPVFGLREGGGSSLFVLLASMVVPVVGLVPSVPAAPPRPPRADSPLMRGVGFRRALSQRVSVAWVNNSTDRLNQHTIRQLAVRSQELWRVSVVLDRRIDPSSELKVEVTNRPVREVLDSLSRPVGGGISEVGNAVYIGPAGDARVLRTLVQLREMELDREIRGPGRDARVARLRKELTIRFEDLVEPREVLAQISRKWKVEIDSLDAIPHDLWAGAEFPGVSATEALSLVLIQYGMTFRWTGAGTGIRIVAPRRPVSLSARYRAKGGRVQAARALVRKELAGVAMEPAGPGEVGVRGIWEDLQVAKSLIERGRRPAGSSSPQRFPPLARRRFTLKVARGRVSDIMKQLEQTGVRFVYDAKAVKAAGVRFDRTVALDVQKVTAEKFFDRLFTPLGLKFSVDGVTVRLSVKR